MHKCPAINDQFTTYVSELWNIAMDTLTSQIELSQENLRMTSYYSIYSTWWSSLKANWQLITTTIIKTILIANYNEKLDWFYAHSPPMTILSDLKKVTKIVGCCIVFKLTTKPMLTFWVGKAEPIELRFRCHMPLSH